MLRCGNNPVAGLGPGGRPKAPRRSLPGRRSARPRPPSYKAWLFSDECRPRASPAGGGAQGMAGTQWAPRCWCQGPGAGGRRTLGTLPGRTARATRSALLGLTGRERLPPCRADRSRLPALRRLGRDPDLAAAPPPHCEPVHICQNRLAVSRATSLRLSPISSSWLSLSAARARRMSSRSIASSAAEALRLVAVVLAS
jgi:hypothetical protein